MYALHLFSDNYNKIQTSGALMFSFNKTLNWFT